MFGHAELYGSDKLPALDDNIEYWLFLGEPIDTDIIIQLEDMDYEPELIVDNGYIGTGVVWIYKVVPKEEKDRKYGEI